MSQELLEMIQLGHAGFNSGDLSRPKLNLADDVEWGTTGTWPGLEGTYRGPQALDQCEGKIAKRQSFRTREEALASVDEPST